MQAVGNNPSWFQPNNLFQEKGLNKVLIVTSNLFLNHAAGVGHPESPKRMEAIWDKLKEAELLTPDNTIEPRMATENEILTCHSSNYYQKLKELTSSLGKKEGSHAFKERSCKKKNVEGDFGYNFKTLESALYAAGAPLTAIDHILDPLNNIKRAYCISRPPGHHAHYPTGSGFCIFNNAVIAAKYAIQKGFAKVLIVDWDVHHGDGTQTMTERDPNIFYFSTHRDTSNGFYPGKSFGKREQTGISKGKGTVLNCPIDPDKVEDTRKAIRDAFDQDLTAAMISFKPNLVIISCGFDAHKNDSLVEGGLQLEDEDYAYLTEVCIRIADFYSEGRIVSILEGGYNLEAIANASKIHVETLARI